MKSDNVNRDPQTEGAVTGEKKMTTTYHVYRNGRTFGVYAQPAKNGTGQELVEGGFFSKQAALDAKAEWKAGVR